MHPLCILVDEDATDGEATDEDATDEDATDEEATDEDATVIQIFLVDGRMKAF